MKLTNKQLSKIKIKLALEGVGAKKRLADEMDCHPSQLTYILDTGKCPDHYIKFIKPYMQ